METQGLGTGRIIWKTEVNENKGELRLKGDESVSAQR
jgi:hypothetical protein